ncbi:hypothetical protein [Ralstonia solanacearum]|uniref:hypothetical protein n=1 Tax=Ralstonia solanacearum TaxID=305 RepID=UPI0007DA28E6|nr:hypothetical protein [Ralstonia solanacearum]
MSIAKPPVSRSPRGVLTERPIVTRLLPHEQVVFETKALEQNRSRASMARLLIVKGMEACGFSVPKSSQG